MTTRSHRSFERFFLDEHPGLVAFGMAWTGDQAAARNLAQEALTRAHRSWTTVELLDLPGAWVRRVLIDLLIDHHRDGVRRGRLAEQLAPVAPPDPSDAAGGAWWPAVRTLPATERAMVTLHCLEDMSIAAVAEILEVKPGTVKASHVRAGETLRAALGEDQLDAMGRAAAAQLRAEARAVANSADALRAVLAEIATPTTPVVVTSSVEPLAPGRRRPNRARPAVALAIAALVAGGYLLISRVGGTFEIATPTGQRAGPGSPAPIGSGASPTSDNPPAPDAPASSPGSSSPGSSAPGSTTAGSTPAGSTTAGSTLPLDSTVPGAAAPGGRHLVVPAVPPASVDDVAALLPEPAPPPERTYRSTSESESAPVLHQTWIRADASEHITAVVQIESRFDDPPSLPDSRPVDVPGWASAAIGPSAGDEAQILLANGNDHVSVSTYGLGDAVTIDLARSLVTEHDDHWVSPLLAGTGWIELERSWTSGFAVRTLTTVDEHLGVETEFGVSRGLTLLQRLPDEAQLDTLTLVDVAGSPAILARGTSSGLVMLRGDGTTVLLGSHDAEADLVAWAETLTDVGVTRWESSAQPWPPDADGCQRVFC